MIKAVIFDLDNTLLDFMTMKKEAVMSAISSMKEAGLDIDVDTSYKEIMDIYEVDGWENQLVFDKFLKNKLGYINNKYLAAGIVAYRRAKEANLKAYPNVQRTLNHLLENDIKLAIVSDAPSREAWMRIYYLGLHHFFETVITFDDSGERKPSPAPFELALGRLNLSNDEVLMVGDWPERDMVGASSVGIKTIFAKYGDAFGVEKSGANWDIEDIYEVVNIIDEINHA
ncbi:MAG: HAD-IA family hydrolase [Candidatus Neomarinimicrobiota bacterium]